MQEHHIAGEAEQRVSSSWYLSRGDKRYGPLADRELLLLAERGGLKKDDLLWKPGFEAWKPVSSVCDLGVPAAAPAQAKPIQDAEYLAPSEPQEANGADPDVSETRAPKPSLKTRLHDELRKFLVFFAYLWLVFLVLFVHEWIVLADNHIGFRFYGLAAINALVLSKVMLVAEGLGFASRLDDKPLIYPIAFKSIAFTALLMLAYFAEEIGVGLFHGKSVAESVPQIGGGGLIGASCVALLLCVALIPFFAFREIARVVGAAEFRALMLGAPRSEPLPSEATPEAA
ncbi:MAG TPA: DUF4339 domain-containing protein [Methyloceanibacter sp.]|jgi:hypothetical protein|nr:DUF4339 domain-containing protein [Methyloceanibacter sp.]